MKRLSQNSDTTPAGSSLAAFGRLCAGAQPADKNETKNYAPLNLTPFACFVPIAGTQKPISASECRKSDKIGHETDILDSARSTRRLPERRSGKTVSQPCIRKNIGSTPVVDSVALEIRSTGRDTNPNPCEEVRTIPPTAGRQHTRSKFGMNAKTGFRFVFGARGRHVLRNILINTRLSGNTRPEFSPCNMSGMGRSSNPRIERTFGFRQRAVSLRSRDCGERST